LEVGGFGGAGPGSKRQCTSSSGAPNQPLFPSGHPPPGRQSGAASPPGVQNTLPRPKQTERHARKQPRGPPPTHLQQPHRLRHHGALVGGHVPRQGDAREVGLVFWVVVVLVWGSCQGSELIWHGVGWGVGGVGAWVGLMHRRPRGGNATPPPHKTQKKGAWKKGPPRTCSSALALVWGSP
jgi:hypothetical protein